jgi:hypothetical protein
MDEFSTSVSAIEVYNAFGQLQSFLPVHDARQTAIDFTSMPSGVYFLKFRNGEEVRGYRVVKR